MQKSESMQPKLPAQEISAESDMLFDASTQLAGLPTDDVFECEHQPAATALTGSSESVETTGAPLAVEPEKIAEILARVRERNSASRKPVQVTSGDLLPDAPEPGIPFPRNPVSLYSVSVSKPQPRRQGGLPELSVQEQDFAEMYGMHYAKVVGEVTGLLSDPHLAEDAAQQVFAYVWQNWKYFAGETDEMRTSWMQLATQKIVAAWNSAAEKEAIPFDLTDEDLYTKQRLAADRYIDGGLQHSAEYLALIKDHTAMERMLKDMTVRKARAIISCFFYDTGLMLTVPESYVRPRADSRVLAGAYKDIVEAVASKQGFLTPELILETRYGRVACAEFVGVMDFD